MNSKAPYSVMTRARAKYGSRLTMADFDALSGLSSLHEAVSYLRSRTHFSPYFENLASDSVFSRVKLETTVKTAFMDEAQRLCGFEKNVGSTIYKYITISNEADLLLDYVINLSQETPEKIIFKLPPKYVSPTKSDFSKLAQINNISDFSRYLRKTKFAKLSTVLPKGESAEFDISLIESTIERIKYGIVFDVINKEFPPETAKTLSEGILMRIELTDFNLIYRAKKYYGLSENSIRANLIGYHCLFSPKVIESIIAAPTGEAALDILKKSRYAPKIERYGIKDLELFCKKAAIDSDIKQIHFSADPAVVLAAYLRIYQAECENIIRITEGISYKMSKEEILENLIII